ncbi:MAG: hypothetical protein KME11_01490 [Timaviella obliquedivisa GSE-PSE-MK23-08B]|jgi:hypothetical protein|nr:hypothetical protein [Timaviella obliquedivisa GSE-PSE-MK23-08B]
MTKFSAALGWVVLTTGLSIGSGLNQSAIAQTRTACQSPRANEYLLLVRNPRTDTQSQLRQLLPANALLTPCNYLNESVVRVEGFASADVANAWAKYLSDQAGLQAIVSSPNSTSVSTAPNPPTTSGAGSFPRPNTTPTTPTTPTTTATSASYNPQPLGSGYAVLVSYFNRPEIAADVRNVTNRNVGLVSFEQRPYLLAAQGTNASSASTVLSQLTQAGLTAVLVDSRGVVLLTADVRR